MNKYKVGILICISSVFFFLFGLSLSPKCENDIITNEIIKEVKIGDEDYNLLKAENQKLKQGIKIRNQIMAVDNIGLIKGSDVIGLFSESISAIYSNDLNKIKRITNEIVVLTDDINILAEQKTKLLLQL